MSSFTSSVATGHLFLIFLALFCLQVYISSSNDEPRLINPCKEQCGTIPIPYPFYLSNNSCGFDGFKLNCSNSTLSLTLNSKEYVVLNISSDSLLIDFFPARSCHAQLDDFDFKGDQLYGISVDNVLQFSECRDTSICREICSMQLCEGKSECCYLLSSYAVWQPGDGFSVFSAFGCKGFSCWHFDPQTERGIKLEWGITKLNSSGLCHPGATVVHARTVDGMRCRCKTGFTGDGFAYGIGCVKSCSRHGRMAYGRVLASTSLLAVLAMLHGLLGRSIQKRRDCDPCSILKTPDFKKNCSIRIFSYVELERATNGFAEKGRLGNFANAMIYAGAIDGGIPVAVEKIQYGGKKDLSLLLNKINILSDLSHVNFVRLIGCSTDLSKTMFLVYELFINGTLEEHLQRKESLGLCWHDRINIVAGIVKALSYLQFEISPPTYHHNISSANIFLDQDRAPRIALFCSVFGPIIEKDEEEICNLGLILLEIITGSKSATDPVVRSKKIDEGKLDEVIDPFLLSHHEQLHLDEVQRVAELGLRCVSVSNKTKPSILQIEEELDSVRCCRKESHARTSLEETFSNSSLLQMISISPDSSLVSSLILENGISISSSLGPELA
ncbi:receptor-like protein kinase [Nymphaea thermarum]|nr:receptor-like protein kinase [Nymphaea thermarum]